MFVHVHFAFPMPSHLCKSLNSFKVWLRYYLLGKLSLALVTLSRKDVPSPRGEDLASCFPSSFLLFFWIPDIKIPSPLVLSV